MYFTKRQIEYLDDSLPVHYTWNIYTSIFVPCFGLLGLLEKQCSILMDSVLVRAMFPLLGIILISICLLTIFPFFSLYI